MGISSHPEILECYRDIIPAFKCLSDDIRAQILILLSDEGEMNVSQITDRLDISRPAVSHHLAQLKQANLVQVRRDGKERFYSIRFLSFLETLEHWIELFRTQCTRLE